MYVAADDTALAIIGRNDRVSSFKGVNSLSGTFNVDWFYGGSSWSFCCSQSASSPGSFSDTNRLVGALVSGPSSVIADRWDSACWLGPRIPWGMRNPSPIKTGNVGPLGSHKGSVQEEARQLTVGGYGSGRACADATPRPTRRRGRPRVIFDLPPALASDRNCRRRCPDTVGVHAPTRRDCSRENPGRPIDRRSVHACLPAMMGVWWGGTAAPATGPRAPRDRPPGAREHAGPLRLARTVRLPCRAAAWGSSGGSRVGGHRRAWVTRRSN